MNKGNFKQAAGIMLFAVFAASVTLPVAAQNTPISPYWTGDGGRGSSITILAPRAFDLAENQGYLPAFVQGEFVRVTTMMMRRVLTGNTLTWGITVCTKR